jgi:restriction system protein
VGEAFRLRGFSVAETGGGGADGGIDLRLKKGSDVFLVQCKQWRAYKVSVIVVRELFGVMASQGATGGFVITSGLFTADARSFAEGRNIELIDGTALNIMIQKVSATQPAGGRLPTFRAGWSHIYPPPYCQWSQRAHVAAAPWSSALADKGRRQGVRSGDVRPFRDAVA